MSEDDQVGRFWPCPRCGSVVFTAEFSFERGFFEDEETYVHFYPPAAYPVEVNTTRVACATCRWKGDLNEIYALDDLPEEMDEHWVEVETEDGDEE